MLAMVPSTGEVLRARKRPWLRRLWVRVLLVLLLIAMISTIFWWWPRKGIVAVWCVNGRAGRFEDVQLARQIRDWIDPAEQSRYRSLIEVVARKIVEFLNTDAHISVVDLSDSNVADEWLTHLRCFPGLRWLTLHDRQVGPGLEHLRTTESLQEVEYLCPSSRGMSNLTRLPHLESLRLRSFPADDVSLEHLSSISKLQFLEIDKCSRLEQLLESLPENQSVRFLRILNCRGYTENSLRCLTRMSDLRTLHFLKSPNIGDDGLGQIANLAQLEELQIYASSTTISEVGLEALQGIKRLKTVIFVGISLPKEPLQKLIDSRPDLTINYR